MFNKKIVIATLVLIFGFLIWYLFIKKNDYEINFKAKAANRTIIQGIEEWAKKNNSDNESYKLISKENDKFLQYEVTSNTNHLVYKWEINQYNDSIKSIKVGIKDFNNSIKNRLSIPFVTTNFKKSELTKITEFKTALDDHLSKFKLGKIAEGTSEEEFVAYIHLKSPLQEKAQKMIMSDGIITSFLFKNNIKIVGKPYLEVTNLDLENEKLEFNYCFPVNKSLKLIADKDVKFKTISSKKGLAITYFGNMRTSDRGWFAIYEYAEKNNIKIDKKPLEHFFANPFNGGDELSWETKIIIPYK